MTRVTKPVFENNICIFCPALACFCGSYVFSSYIGVRKQFANLYVKDRRGEENICWLCNFASRMIRQIKRSVKILNKVCY